MIDTMRTSDGSYQFNEMMGFIHLPEKWFYIMKRTADFYILLNEMQLNHAAE